MKISKALDWEKISILISRQLSEIGYNPDLHRMFHNIEKMNTELSKLEVNCRRYKNTAALDEPLKKINESITHLEQLIIIAKIMK